MVSGVPFNFAARKAPILGFEGVRREAKCRRERAEIEPDRADRE